MYAWINSSPAISSDTFSWKMSGLLQSPIGSRWYSNFPKGSTIVQYHLEVGFNSKW